jgi:hypothetical protein
MTTQRQRLRSSVAAAFVAVAVLCVGSLQGALYAAGALCLFFAASRSAPMKEATISWPISCPRLLLVVIPSNSVCRARVAHHDFGGNSGHLLTAIGCYASLFSFSFIWFSPYILSRCWVHV